MPIIIDQKVSSARVILWELTESDIEIANTLDCHHELVNSLFKNQNTKLSFGWKYVLKTILNNDYTGIYKDEHGKPFLIDSKLNFSVSHTKNIIAIALHEHKEIGIDIEYCSDKVERVKHKFLCDQELNNISSLTELTQFWCIKEATYKLNGKKNISFKNEILINPTNNYSGSVYIKDIQIAQYELSIYDDLIISIAIAL